MNKLIRNRNPFILVFCFLVTIHFINSIIGHHFGFTFIPKYISLIYYTILVLVTLLILKRTKRALIFIGLLFGIALIVFFSSFRIANKLMQYNQEKIESSPSGVNYVFYGVYPSKAKFDWEKNQAQIRGLHGSVYTFDIETMEWYSSD